MLQTKPITWRERWGNKFNRGLHPAMLTEGNYHKLAFIRLLDGTEAYCEIEYDKEYAVAFVAQKLCKPLNGLSLDVVLDLVREAYLRCQEEDRNRG